MTNFLWHRSDTESLERVLRAGNLSSYGEPIKRWEREFADWIGWGEGLATSSGTAALTLALQAAGVRPGDHVAVPSLTFVATAQAILAAGAAPVFVDVHPQTWCLDPDCLRAALARFPIKAVVAVHFLGNCCDMAALSATCREAAVPLVEDAAQAFGTLLVKPGDQARTLAFSFDARKQLPVGQGGMLLSDDPALLDRARVHRHCGLVMQEGEFVAGEYGVNLLPSVLSAALGTSVLRRVASWNEFRRQLCQRLDAGVAHLPFITRQQMDASARPSPQRWAVLVEGEIRARILELARKRGLPMSPLYRPAHTHPYFAGFTCADELRTTARFEASNVCLEFDMSAGLEQGDAALQLIVDATREAGIP